MRGLLAHARCQLHCWRRWHHSRSVYWVWAMFKESELQRIWCHDCGRVFFHQNKPTLGPS